MEMMDLVGYVGALSIGIVLGLIGGGGSILTVPVLVYILAINPVVATAYSLFIVGATSLVGAFKNIQKKLVDFKTATVFSVPAFVSVYLTRKYLVPFIPDHIFSFFGLEVTKNIGIMLFFAIVMVAASVSMIRERKGKKERTMGHMEPHFNYPLIVIEGLVVGALTGIVGAGGGFLIIPALVLLGKLPMKKAVATSLLIIAVKSLIGFMGDVQNLEIDWPFLLIFTCISVIGIFLGIYLNRFINGEKLKRAFGWFVLVMGLYILGKEIL
ncbi:MAG: sulfite exporter TauE/SafE family protein [Sediminicola sp.]